MCIYIIYCPFLYYYVNLANKSIQTMKSNFFAFNFFQFLFLILTSYNKHLWKLEEAKRHRPPPPPRPNAGEGAVTPSHIANKKIIQRKTESQKSANKNFIPSKNIKQISKKVLTIMKTYGKIDMQSKDCD